MRFLDLCNGQYFHFDGVDTVWQYRGQGWYSSPGGYDGGPWHSEHNSRVFLYECPGCGENHCPGCVGCPQTLSCFV